MPAHQPKDITARQRLWRELVWLKDGWRDREPPDRWNPILVRELRRGSWRDGLAPRVLLLQFFCIFAWVADSSGQADIWSLLPTVCVAATILLEARLASADHRADTWELFCATGRSHRLWWKGWKQLHLVNLMASLTTLLPWAIVVNLTNTSSFETFCVSVLLCVPASCLALRRWTAFGLVATPWKRFTLMGMALLWIELMMMVGWSKTATGLGSFGSDVLFFRPFLVRRCSFPFIAAFGSRPGSGK